MSDRILSKEEVESIRYHYTPSSRIDRMCTSHEALRAEVDDSARRLKEADRCHEALTERVEVLEKALWDIEGGAKRTDGYAPSPWILHITEFALKATAPAQAEQKEKQDEQ